MTTRGRGGGEDGEGTQRLHDGELSGAEVQRVVSANIVDVWHKVCRWYGCQRIEIPTLVKADIITSPLGIGEFVARSGIQGSNQKDWARSESGRGRGRWDGRARSGGRPSN